MASQGASPVPGKGNATFPNHPGSALIIPSFQSSFSKPYCACEAFLRDFSTTPGPLTLAGAE